MSSIQLPITESYRRWNQESQVRTPIVKPGLYKQNTERDLRIGSVRDSVHIPIATKIFLQEVIDCLPRITQYDERSLQLLSKETEEWMKDCGKFVFPDGITHLEIFPGFKVQNPDYTDANPDEPTKQHYLYEIEDFLKRHPIVKMPLL